VNVHRCFRAVDLLGSWRAGVCMAWGGVENGMHLSALACMAQERINLARNASVTAAPPC